MKEPSALVFNLVRSSFVDGPGVRTTVFLKGCPLRCRWCCNPEGQSYQNQLRVQLERCTGCGQCLSLCPQNALSLCGERISVDRACCNGCGACVSSCWFGALSLWGRPTTVSELTEELLRDRELYARSGGGVTIGGGEASSFPDFCLPLIDRLHDEGIHVAVDTCGYAVTREQKNVLHQADLLLFDIKGLGEERHRRNTGVSNKPILENLCELDRAGKPIIIRCPVIPKYNQDEIRAVADFLAAFSCIRRVDLIAYHEYGSAKYSETGMKYTMDANPLPQEELEALRDYFQGKGLVTQLGG